MKGYIVALAASRLISTVAAFPRMDAEQLKTYYQHSKKSAEACPFAEAQQKREGEACPFAKAKRASTFDATAQHIDVEGQYAFIPPNFDAGDQRGPCPGLNALANHGYLPHDGVADIDTIIKATNEVYGMSLDLGGFLAVYGTVVDGNPLSTSPGYSIGGPSKDSQNILGGLGLLGTPTGLSGSHNKYESDVSPTRGDLYLAGNNFQVQRDRFIDYWNALPENTPADEQYTALAPFHKQRFDESVSTNPYFFYSPFSGVLVSPAGYSFPKAMMANHSDQYPDGYLSRENLVSFFGVQGTSPDNFVVNQGWERIPENWYKRPIGDDYSIPKFLVDVVEHALYYPPLLSVGGNTGTTNSFTGVDISDLTGGVFNAATLLEGDNLECFVLQSVQAATPDILGTEFSDVTAAMAPLTDNIAQLLAGKACPQLQSINTKLFENYPGYTQSYGTYAGLSSGSVSGVVGGVTGVVGGLLPRD
ncbi:hypothetical protein BJ170DRAFT_695627 [Xylariales sp. AK1849]|nr:hypothetical protein BJ170DRAFT_695627 [Xylariales sp. AK1849]